MCDKREGRHQHDPARDGARRDIIDGVGKCQERRCHPINLVEMVDMSNRA